MSDINFLDKTGLSHFWSKIKSLFLMTGDRGTEIPSNADLNTYTTPGTYYSISSTVSNTLSNVPKTNSGFTLYVIRSYTSSRLIQYMCYTNAMRYIRYCYNSAWTDWYQDYSEKQKPTADDVGLGNVDNTSDLDKPVSTATQAALESYLPLTGGTVSGTIEASSFDGDGSSLTNLSASNISSGTLSASYGGTGEANLTDSANALINALSVGNDGAIPVDDDYYVSQWVDGGTSKTDYFRRKMSTLYDYIKGKTDSVYLPLTGNANTATTIANARSIDGIPFDGSADITHYGTCGTATATKAKVVECDGFTLVTGARIYVKFTYAQTYNGQVTLNVNSTGAKNVTQRGTVASVRYEWMAGEIVPFVYDGTYWVIERGSTATTTYYGRTKLSTSLASTSGSLAATPSTVNILRSIINGYSVYSTSAKYSVGARVIYDTHVYECTTAITTAESWNSAHWSMLDTLQDQIDDIATTRYHKYLFLGDSYDVIQGDTTVSGTVAECLGLSSSDWVKLSVGGYGFAPQYSGQTSSTWISRLQTYVSNHSEDELAKFTDFVIFGGANDTATTEAQMDTAVSEFITYARQYFVNARFYLGFTGWTRDTTAHEKYRQTRNLYYSMAEKYGFAYLHNVEYVLHNYDYLMTDSENYHHPTAEGVIRVGKAIAECILSGTCHVRYNENITFTSSVSYGTVLGGIIAINDDTAAITFSNLTLNANNSTSGLPFGQWSVVGTYSTPLLKSNVSSKIFVTANTTKEIGFLLVEFKADGTFRVAQFASNSTPKNQFLLSAQSTADFRFNTMLN